MAPSVVQPVHTPQATAKSHHAHWKFKLHPRTPAPALVPANPIGAGQDNPRTNGDRPQQPNLASVAMSTSTSTSSLALPTVAPSTAATSPDRLRDDVMPIPPAVMLVLTVAIATIMCMCTIWCIRRCGRTPTEPYEDEYEAVEAAGYRPYARNGGSSHNSPVLMTQTSRPPTTTSRHSMLDPSPTVGHQMLEDDDRDDIFLHMHSPNRGPRYSRPRSFPDWHQGHQRQLRDLPSRRQGGRTPLPVYSVIMSPLTAAHTADLLQRELELLHQAREAGIALRAPPSYDEAVGTSIGSAEDDDDDELVFPQAAAAAAAAAAASTEQDLGDGVTSPFYQPPTVRTFATVARSVMARSTSLHVPAPPPPSSASSIASYHSDSEHNVDGEGENQQESSPHPSRSHRIQLSPSSHSTPLESSPLAARSFSMGPSDDPHAHMSSIR